MTKNEREAEILATLEKFAAKHGAGSTFLPNSVAILLAATSLYLVV